MPFARTHKPSGAVCSAGTGCPRTAGPDRAEPSRVTVTTGLRSGALAAQRHVGREGRPGGGMSAARGGRAAGPAVPAFPPRWRPRVGVPLAELPCPALPWLAVSRSVPLCPPPGCDVCAPLGGRRGVPGGEEGS